MPKWLERVQQLASRLLPYPLSLDKSPAHRLLREHERRGLDLSGDFDNRRSIRRKLRPI